MTSLHQAILNSVDAQIAVLDGSGRIVDVNRAWLDAGARGGVRTPWVGVDYLAICREGATPEDPGPRLAADGIESVLRGRRQEYSIEYPCQFPDQLRWFRMRARPLDGSPPGHCVVAHEDITEHVLAEQRLQDLACVDPLTRLANRRGLELRWQEEWERCRRARQPLALLWRPGRSPDGEAWPDEVLRDFANTLRSFARRPGDLAGRLGGGELVLLLSGVDQGGAASVARRLDQVWRATGQWAPEWRLCVQQPAGEPALPLARAIALATPQSADAAGVAP